MKTSESIKNIIAALSKAQGEMSDIVKLTENPNPQFKRNGKLSKYASLDAVTDMVRGPCSSNGIFYSQEIKTISMPITEKWSLPIYNDKGEISVQEVGENYRDSAHALTARVFHSSGEWIEYEPMILPIENTRDSQKVKSSVTLMRRAQLLSIFGLAEEDDDGNAAAGFRSEPAQRPAPKVDPMAFPYGDLKGTHISKVPPDKTREAIDWCKKKGVLPEFIKAAEEFLNAKKPKQDPNDGPPPDFDQESIPF